MEVGPSSPEKLLPPPYSETSDIVSWFGTPMGAPARRDTRDPRRTG